jgi:predicted O-methyltransferase YrrM
MKKIIKSVIRVLFHLRDWVLFIFTYPVSVARFKALHQQASATGRFNVPFTYQGVGEFSYIRPKQVMFEITELYKTVGGLNPKTVLEIGTYKGGTLYLWCQAAADHATIVSIDFPMGELTHPFSLRRRLFYRHFARTPAQKLHFIAADSHRQQTLDRVKAALQGQTIDFLFIDGDHSYEGVKQDFDMYAPLVSPGGLIAFHDILPRPQLPQIKVYQFWQETRKKYDSHEIVARQGDMAEMIGIGIIKKS